MSSGVGFTSGYRGEFDNAARAYELYDQLVALKREAEKEQLKRLGIQQQAWRHWYGTPQTFTSSDVAKLTANFTIHPGDFFDPWASITKLPVRDCPSCKKDHKWEGKLDWQDRCENTLKERAKIYSELYWNKYEDKQVLPCSPSTGSPSVLGSGL